MTELAPTPDDVVDHPLHYNRHPSGIECIDITRDLTFDAGNAVKYVWRCYHKNGAEDLQKAAWYLTDGIEHYDGIFFARNMMALREKLDRVINHETDPNRIRFFVSIRGGYLRPALAAVKDMLGGASL